MSSSSQPLLGQRLQVNDSSLASVFYPVIGIYYFLRHPFLWPLVRARLLPCFLLSAFILGNLFFWTYLPQVAFLALFHSVGAWINGTFLVLGEGAAIVALLFEAFLVDETQVDIFDAVLVERGFEDLVGRYRPVTPLAVEAALVAAGESGGDLRNPVKRLGKPFRNSVYGPFSFRQIFEFIVFLPLNLVPVIGVPVFLFLTGYRAGPLHHWRYFKLLDFDGKQKKREIKRRQAQYTGFGMITLVLQLVPVLSMLFLMTTAAGSALWAAKIEKRRREDQVQARQRTNYVDNPV